MNIKSTPKYKITLPVTVLLQLDSRLRSTLRKTLLSRKFYLEINDKILSKTSTLDANLYFICYFTLFLSSILRNKQKIRAFLLIQKQNLAKVINKYYSSVFDKPLIEETSASIEKKSENSEEKDLFQRDPAVTSNLAVHLKAISSYVADVRIFNRLTEAIKYMPWIIDEYTALLNLALEIPRYDRFVNFLQSINCLVLELFENAGWLTDHNWVGFSDNSFWSMEAYIWCSRVWGAYLVIEVLELLRRTPRAKRNLDWQKTFFTQVIQLPLVAHWSLYDGCLSPFWVGVCGSGASWFGFIKTWQRIDLS